MFIAPMLLETTPAPFNHADYIFEPKIDGHRLLLSRINGETHLYTRHNNDCTHQYPELNKIALDDVILDGEVAATDESGRVDFESIMERFSLRKPDKVQNAAHSRPVNYVVFDILHYKGEDLRGYPLHKRKELLATLDFGNANIALIPSVEAEGEQLYSKIEALKMEGIVAKRANSIYVSNRSSAWQKIINWTYVDVVITGYRKGDFGWLAAVPEKNGKFRPVGVIELGVTPRHKMAFYSIKDRLLEVEDRDYVHLEPRLRAKVKIRNWTKAGLLRSPVFVDFLL
ncbi:ATP-dependent DNA ligase [Paenibacillus sp. LMG 31456]|uniref:ATP-dependent DNA ligase n=1 Tax=Paenibacillus foliorum TaxID=2654974 RepID=A0A972K1C8_9BACL|nr:ATP-dependent DNA ligase [Paenibacillus foliorum]NOU95571.1 ATP-dependent DNA ligase [Paenibacillus foliorum]